MPDALKQSRTLPPPSAAISPPRSNWLLDRKSKHYLRIAEHYITLAETEELSMQTHVNGD